MEEGGGRSLLSVVRQKKTGRTFMRHANLYSHNELYNTYICWYVVCLLLFYAIATVFQIYHGGDMMYEMRKGKPDPTLLLTQGIFNLPHHIGRYERTWPLIYIWFCWCYLDTDATLEHLSPHRRECWSNPIEPVIAEASGFRILTCLLKLIWHVYT